MVVYIKNQFITWKSSFKIFKFNRALILDMTKKDLSDQYAGQVLGLLWSIIHPLMFIGVYIFIFAFIFHSKVGGTLEMPLDYTSYILSGLVPWLGFQMALVKTSVALISESNLVKQVVFPIEVLPIKMVLSSFFGQFISLAILLLYVLINYHTVPLTYTLLPILLLSQFLFTLGVGYFLSIATPFIRDVKDVITVYSIVGIYLVPVVYLPQWVPSVFKPILYINPVSYMIWCYQDALYFGRIQHLWVWVIYLSLSVLFYSIGYSVFQKFKSYVGNVL